MAAPHRKMAAMTESSQMDREVEFKIDELFFSRTDDRGIIQSGNSIFQRVSEYSWEEMINAPHKIVRHPEMPRTVFWILWDRLKRGKPVGAYVKNRSKSGGHYWVYAMVTPIEDGYLSVRMKPTSAYLPIVKKIYTQILADEARPDFEFEEGVSLLQNALADHGLRDYNHFMATTVVAETKARDEELNLNHRQNFDSLSQLVTASSRMLGRSADVKNDFNRIRGFPINLRIQSGKFSSVAKLFGVISDDYNRFCQGIESHLTEFTNRSVKVADQLAEAVFLVCTSRYQEEVAKIFEREADHEDDDGNATEIDLLRRQAEEFSQTTAEAILRCEEGARSFNQISSDVGWLLGGLDLVRILGTAETSRIGDRGQTLQKMMSEAERFQEQIKTHLDDLRSLNKTVLDETAVIRSAA